ncbi:MAG: hypothetical protein KY475_06255 [Planctomycetes bacterium]|nr:hypothetical protein [Planctomycetota bacterium]
MSSDLLSVLPAAEATFTNQPATAPVASAAASAGVFAFPPTPEQIQAAIQKVLGKQLSPEFSQWVERYAQVGRRNPYLWNWCRQAVEITTLPCVPAEWKSELCDTKTLGVMWDVMLDDLADQNGDGRLMEELLRLPQYGEADLTPYSSREREYAQFTCDLWREIMRRVRRLPRFAEFEDLLRFDYLQLCNVMRYSHLLNRHPELLNLVEHDSYTPHNMHIMICSTIDVMASPDFQAIEFGKLREVVWNAQWMGRIGNLVTTWQRELGENDFTSGVYARAVACGDLTLGQLYGGDRAAIEKAILDGGHEEHYLQRWRKHHAFLLSDEARLESFDVRRLAAGLEQLICLHLGSRGYK